MVDAVLEDERVVLDESLLDGEPACECYDLLLRQECGQAATHLLRCRNCATSDGFICRAHLLYFTYTPPMVTGFFRTTCCGVEGTFSTLLRAVPL